MISPLFFRVFPSPCPFFLISQIKKSKFKKKIQKKNLRKKKSSPVIISIVLFFISLLLLLLLLLMLYILFNVYFCGFFFLWRVLKLLKKKIFKKKKVLFFNKKNLTKKFLLFILLLLLLFWLHTESSFIYSIQNNRSHPPIRSGWIRWDKERNPCHLASFLSSECWWMVDDCDSSLFVDCTCKFYYSILVIMVIIVYCIIIIIIIITEKILSPKKKHYCAELKFQVFFSAISKEKWLVKISKLLLLLLLYRCILFI